MFEKEARRSFDELDDRGVGNDWSIEDAYENGFSNGAEFAFNKANEWNYSSKGKYPKENKRYLCKIKCFVGGGISYECLDYDIEYDSWKNTCGDVIAWKEIVYTKESE